MNVVLATPTWSLNGPNVFSASLVRGLKLRNIPAHIVLTRPDWLDPKPLPSPPDVLIEKLPVNRFMSFRARCRAMLRYLEERAPCIYIPNYDIGHSCISPHLSPSIAIIGIVHSDDSRHYEHVARLGGYWNAVVAVSSAIAGETRRIAPALAPRLSVIPYGIGAPPAFTNRAAKELAQNGARRETVPDSDGGARRALCAAKELAQNGARRETVPDSDGGARRALCASGTRPLRVVYAGRLDQPQKRVLDLVEIVQAVADLGVPVRLTIVGSGPAEAQLKARLGSNQSVEFLGTLESEPLARVLAGQDVFLLTSAFEGLPIGVLDAMGQGCIPVVSDVRSGIPELIEDGVDGFRVPIGDIRGFAKRLAELYTDETMRRRMAQAAFTKAGSGCYRLGHMVECYVKLFETVLDDARRGAFRRPAGKIQPPPNLPWPERLPGILQKWGHGVKQLLTRPEEANAG